MLVEGRLVRNALAQKCFRYMNAQTHPGLVQWMLLILLSCSLWKGIGLAHSISVRKLKWEVIRCKLKLPLCFSPIRSDTKSVTEGI